MKKVFIFILVIIMLLPGATAYCASLSCACTPEADMVTGFKLKINNAPAIDVPTVMTCGTTDPVVCTGNSRTMCFDLTPYPNGNITVVGAAVNVWGSSADSPPFSFVKGAPSTYPSFFIKK